MQCLISFLAIIIVLTACSPSTAMPTATIEILPSVTLTSTPEPTATATETTVPTETFAPINIVTDLKDIANAPDGSTPELRAGIAASILQMYADGKIPNFDPSVQAFMPVRVTNIPANENQPFFFLDDTNDSTRMSMNNINSRPFMGVALVQGENKKVLGIQAVKQKGTNTPGLIWYDMTNKWSKLEVSYLFNKDLGQLMLPGSITDLKDCNVRGLGDCSYYSNPDVHNAQVIANNKYINNGMVPDEMTSGQVVFMAFPVGVGN